MKKKKVTFDKTVHGTKILINGELKGWICLSTDGGFITTIENIDKKNHKSFEDAKEFVVEQLK